MRWENHMALLNVEQAKFHIKSVLVYIGIVLSSNNVGDDKKCYTEKGWPSPHG